MFICDGLRVWIWVLDSTRECEYGYVSHPQVMCRAAGSQLACGVAGLHGAELTRLRKGKASVQQKEVGLWPRGTYVTFNDHKDGIG